MAAVASRVGLGLARPNPTPRQVVTLVLKAMPGIYSHTAEALAFQMHLPAWLGRPNATITPCHKRL